MEAVRLLRHSMTMVTLLLLLTPSDCQRRRPEDGQGGLSRGTSQRRISSSSDGPQTSNERCFGPNCNGFQPLGEGRGLRFPDEGRRIRFPDEAETDEGGGQGSRGGGRGGGGGGGRGGGGQKKDRQGQNSNFRRNKEQRREEEERRKEEDRKKEEERRREEERRKEEERRISEDYYNYSDNYDDDYYYYEDEEPLPSGPTREPPLPSGPTRRPGQATTAGPRRRPSVHPALNQFLNLPLLTTQRPRKSNRKPQNQIQRLNSGFRKSRLSILDQTKLLTSMDPHQEKFIHPPRLNAGALPLARESNLSPSIFPPFQPV